MHHYFLIHSSGNGRPGCFRALTVVNSAAMNIGIHVSLSVLVSSVCMPSSGIVGDAGYSMLGAGALRQLRGMVWGGTWQGSSGWGPRVYLWWIHVDVWQN